VLILHWVTPREHLMSIWIPIDIALVLFNIALFLVILFRSTKVHCTTALLCWRSFNNGVALIVQTKSKIGAFLEEENVHYNRVGLNLRLVQERTLAGYPSHSSQRLRGGIGQLIRPRAMLDQVRG
jgi:hypothetical protein